MANLLLEVDPDAPSLGTRVERILRFLQEHGTFDFPVLPNGLYPAASTSNPDHGYLGYDMVWVRDNIHIANHFPVIGEPHRAERILGALLEFYRRNRRHEGALKASGDARNPEFRPHVRFDGRTLTEVDQPWNHNQNDALGYLVWLFAKLAREGAGVSAEEQIQTVAELVRFLDAIDYATAEDSGHWEEVSKISASSIGTVVAGLRALRLAAERRSLGKVLKASGVPSALLERLLADGENALRGILPAECVQADPLKARAYDAALLFLIEPLGVVDDAMADRILANAEKHLERENGFIRYPGDTFWAPDYKARLPAAERTERLRADGRRARLVVSPGEEAQWCLFSPIVSVIYGRRYRRSGNPADLALQAHHFGRALRQLTPPNSPHGAFRCPEAYYLENGRWQPNDATPLLWTQANLRLAIHEMQQSATVRDG